MTLWTLARSNWMRFKVPSRSFRTSVTRLMKLWQKFWSRWCWILRQRSVKNLFQNYKRYMATHSSSMKPKSRTKSETVNLYVSLWALMSLLPPKIRQISIMNISAEKYGITSWPLDLQLLQKRSLIFGKLSTLSNSRCLNRHLTLCIMP